MNKIRFLASLPSVIKHKLLGTGALEICRDGVKDKAACYRHDEKTSSYRSTGESWLEVYYKMLSQLEKHEHVILKKNSRLNKKFIAVTSMLSGLTEIAFTFL